MMSVSFGGSVKLFPGEKQITVEATDTPRNCVAVGSRSARLRQCAVNPEKCSEQCDCTCAKHQVCHELRLAKNTPKPNAVGEVGVGFWRPLSFLALTKVRVVVRSWNILLS